MVYPLSKFFMKCREKFLRENLVEKNVWLVFFDNNIGPLVERS